MALYSDDFNVADTTPFTGHTLDGGQSWVQSGARGSAAGSGIINQRAYGGLHNNNFWFVDDTPSTNDYIIGADFIRLDATDRTYGVLGRFNLVAFQGYMAFVDLTTATIFRYDNSSGGSSLASSVTPFAAVDSRIELECQGSTIRLFHQRLSDGEWADSSSTTTSTRTPLITATDSTYSSGNVGIKLGRNSTSTSARHADNYQVDSFGQDFTQDISDSLSVDQSVLSKAFRTPLIISSGRIRRLADGDFIKGQEPNEFLVQALSDTVSATYYYFGGIDSNGNWKINRYLKTNLNSKSTATISNNGSYSTLGAAWTDRASLSYT